MFSQFDHVRCSFSSKRGGIFLLDVYEGTSSECKICLKRRSSSFILSESTDWRITWWSLGRHDAGEELPCLSWHIRRHFSLFSRRTHGYMYLTEAKSPCLYHASRLMCPEIG